MAEFDFVAIGDITTDAFIRLSGNQASIESDDTRKRKICFNFGDKVEYDQLIEVPAVGNSPNAAVAAHRLGLRSALLTDIGDDHHGQQCLEALKQEGVSTDLVRTHTGKESNYHFVLWYEEERTILVRHQAYTYELPDIGTPTWLYLSSIGKNSLAYHHAIAQYVKDHPGINLAFQPGTFQIQMGKEELRDLYAVSELFFCNVQEAQRILGVQTSDINALLSGIRDLGPTTVVITDGPAGAYVDDKSGSWHMPMYPDIAPPIDRTGAGDSFSSTFTAALALGKDIPEALSWGPINSMSVVQQVGAQKGLLTREQIESYLAQAPADYKPAKIR